MQERAVGPGDGADLGGDGQDPPGGLPISGPVVLAAQLVITYWAGNHTRGLERGYVMSGRVNAMQLPGQLAVRRSAASLVISGTGGVARPARAVCSIFQHPAIKQVIQVRRACR